MIEIDTKKDMNHFLNNPSYSTYFKSLVTNNFHDLVQAYCHEESEEDFSLHTHGKLAVLEGTEDLRYYFNRDLLMIEFVEIHQLNEEKIYQANILEDNDYMVVLFMNNEILKCPIRNWLHEYVEGYFDEMEPLD